MGLAVSSRSGSPMHRSLSCGEGRLKLPIFIVISLPFITVVWHNVAYWATGQSPFVKGSIWCHQLFVQEQSPGVSVRGWWKLSCQEGVQRPLRRQSSLMPWRRSHGVVCSLWLRDWNNKYSTCERRFWRGSVPRHRHGSHQGLKETGVPFLTPSPFLAPGKLPTNCIVSLPTPSWVSELISCPADSKVKNKPRNVKTCFYSERWRVTKGI